jgi:hypothetical protein
MSIPRFAPKRLKAYVAYAIFYLIFFVILLFVAAFGLIAEA